jgi:hypothetical protein
MIKQTQKSRKPLKKLTATVHTYPDRLLFFFDEGRLNPYAYPGKARRVPFTEGTPGI